MWRIVTAALVASLVLSAAAQAADGDRTKRSIVFRAKPVHAHARLPITRDAALLQSVLAARQFWAGWTPRCGQPAIVAIKLDRPISGLAEFDPCRIDLQAVGVSNAARYPGGFYNLCQTVAHEWGHEVLGPTYFAASNPSDPGHSADPDSVMAARPRATTPQCLAALNGAYYDTGWQVRRTRVEIHGRGCRVFLGRLLVKDLNRCVNADPAQTLT